MPSEQDSKFAAAAVEKGHLNTSFLSQAKSVHDDYKVAGENKTLAEVCLELGLLTEEQVQDIQNALRGDPEEGTAFLDLSEVGTSADKVFEIHETSVDRTAQEERGETVDIGFGTSTDDGAKEDPGFRSDEYKLTKLSETSTRKTRPTVGTIAEDTRERNFGKYEIIRELSRGGMGAILIGRDGEIDREVAIKIIRPDVTVSRSHLARFMMEARVQGQLEHPNICPVYELACDEFNNPYFAMKFVRGRPLSTIIKEGASLPEMLDVFLKVCDAISYAHAKGVIHRDLKPENIMVGEFGEVLLMDFGIAKIVGEKDELENAVQVDRAEIRKMLDQQQGSRHSGQTLKTMDGGVMGTPAYMPPEQAEGKISRMDQRSDIYSLGAVLYEILTGAPPFEGSPYKIISQVISGNFEKPSKKKITNYQLQNATEKTDTTKLTADSSLQSKIKNPKSKIPGVPHELEAVVLKAMATNMEDRYGSVEELKKEIIAYEEGRALKAMKYSYFALAWKWIKRNRAVSIPAGIFIFAAFVVGFILVWSEAEKRLLAQESEQREKFIDELFDTAIEDSKEALNNVSAWEFLRARSTWQENRQETASEKEQRQRVLDALLSACSKLSQALAIRSEDRVRERRIEIGALLVKVALSGEDYTLATQAIHEISLVGCPEEKLIALRTDVSESRARREELRSEQRRALDHYSRGLAYMMNSNLERAVEEFDLAIELSLSTSDCHFYRGRARYLLGNVPGAREDLDRAILLDAKSAKAYHLRGVTREDQGDKVGAMADYVAAIDLDSKLPLSYRSRGELREENGDFEGALSDLEKFVSIAPRNTDLEEINGKLVKLRARIRDRRVVPTGELRATDAKLSSGAYIDWTDVRVDAGHKITISLTSDEFDTILLFEDSEGNQLENDDSLVVGGTNSGLEFVSEKSGVCKIGVSSYGIGDTGRYRLLYEVVQSQSFAGTLDSADQNADGTRFIEWIEVQAQQGSRARVTLRSNDFDPYLIYVDSSGKRFENDDSQEVEGNGSRVECIAAKDGVCRIGVTTYDEGESGNYRVEFEIVKKFDVSGTLAEGDSQRSGDKFVDWTEVQLDRGARLLITMVSGYFDSYIVLRDSNGLVAENDDDSSPEGWNSRLAYTAPRAGRYRIGATSAFAGKTGSYRLQYEIMAGDVGNRALDEFDEKRPGGEFIEWTEVELGAGSTITVTLTSEAFDTYLVLLDARGNETSNDDDATAGGSNSRLRHVAQIAGTVRIGASSYSAGGTGAYQLEWEIEEAVAPDDEWSGTGALEASDEQREGRFIDWRTAELQPGWEITITLTSESFDTVLYLVGPDGSEWSNDDSEEVGGTNSRLKHVALTAGTYRIGASSYEEGATGDYSLSYAIVRGEVLEPSWIEEGALAEGDQLRDGKFIDWYEVELTIDTKIVVTVRSDDFDTFLLFETADGQTLENDDSEAAGGTGLNSRIEYTAGVTGTCRFGVTTYEAGLQGTYRVEYSVTRD
ncbi:MAG: protein kinase [Planctomycetes bacterium]|nr:protein kinase [Planctomycetota bacterium]